MSYADRDKYGMYKDTRHAGPGPALMGADTLIGDSVVNGKEENLGDIKEIMLDMQTGQVAYAVLAFGGFLGMGEKLFAVPWQALHLDTAHHRFVLNVEKEKLKNAPGFDKDAWPDMSDVNWASGIHSFYGTDMDRPGAPTMGPGVAVGGMVGGASDRGSGASRMGSGMGSSMGSGSAGGGDLGSGSGLGGVGSGTSNAGMGSGAGGGSSNLGGSAGSGTAGGASSPSYGPGGSADPRPGHEGDDKDLSRIRGSNIG